MQLEGCGIDNTAIPTLAQGPRNDGNSHETVAFGTAGDQQMEGQREKGTHPILDWVGKSKASNILHTKSKLFSNFSRSIRPKQSPCNTGHLPKLS